MISPLLGGEKMALFHITLSGNSRGSIFSGHSKGNSKKRESGNGKGVGNLIHWLVEIGGGGGGEEAGGK